MKTYLKTILLLFVTGFSWGCAFTPDKINLEYTARGLREPIPGANEVNTTVRVADQRPKQDRVGRKNTESGWGGGAIVSRNDVTELVKNSIAEELRLRGFSQGTECLISCQLEQFYNRFTMGFWAGDAYGDFALKVTVKNQAGSDLFARTIATTGHEPNIQVARGHNAKAALEQALSKGMEELFQDREFIAALFRAAGVTQP